MINLQNSKERKQDAKTTPTDDTTEYQVVKSMVQPFASEWRHNSVGLLGSCSKHSLTIMRGIQHRGTDGMAGPI